ncbi:MAG: hypothetical protein HYZ28_20785 [Myxococcales bacterium]|nr:hypothetical protein [Myxococcales bacterium]
MAVNLNIQTNVNIQVQGYAAFNSVNVGQAAQAQQLLGLLGSQSGFSAAAQAQFTQLTGGANAYAGLLPQPPGFGQPSISAAHDVLASVGWGADYILQNAQHAAATGDVVELDRCRRMALVLLKDIVRNVATQLKDISAMLGTEKQVGGVDKFATHHSCREGKNNPSNMNDSDHIKLAIYNILNRDGTGPYKGLTPAELAKKLESEYGIKAEVTKVKSKEGDELNALKFENGAVFADGAGDGALELRDYDFKGAVDDITKRTGVTPEQFAKNAAEFKADRVAMVDFRKQLAAFEKEAADLYGKLDHDLQATTGPLHFGGGVTADELNQMIKAYEAGKIRQNERYSFPMGQVSSIFFQAYMFAGVSATSLN